MSMWKPKLPYPYFTRNELISKVVAVVAYEICSNVCRTTERAEITSCVEI